MVMTVQASTTPKSWLHLNGSQYLSHAAPHLLSAAIANCGHLKNFSPPPLNLSSSSIPPLRALGRSPHVHTLTYTLTCLLKTNPFCSALGPSVAPSSYSAHSWHIQFCIQTCSDSIFKQKYPSLTLWTPSPSLKYCPHLHFLSLSSQFTEAVVFNPGCTLVWSGEIFKKILIPPTESAQLHGDGDRLQAF